MTGSAEVRLAGKRVGILQLIAGDRSFFTFDESYLNDANRPVLSQSFYKPSGAVIPETKISQTKLPPFFSNLLPEGALREYLAKRGNVNSEREFMLLALLGEDLPGAVSIHPAADLKKSKTDDNEARGKNAEKPYHFSLAGIQLKFSALGKKNGGLTIPASGVGGDWIIKLPSTNYPQVPENEWAMLHLAGEIGIPVPETHLVNIDEVSGLPDVGAMSEIKALAVKRFDRGDKGQRIHIEDFAQVYNLYPEDKYDKVSYGNITRLVWTLTGEAGLVNFIRRLTFVVVTGNGDMHLKNWSFIYRDGRTPELTPAYDLVSTVPYIAGDRLALTLSGTKEMSEVSIAHFKKLAEKAGVPEHLVLKTVQETAQATLAAWHKNKKEYGLDKGISDRIESHMKTLNLG